MAKKSKIQKHEFRNKLILNQWLISQFGIDPFIEKTVDGKKLRPFHRLARPIKDQAMEGIGNDNLHNFYYTLIRSELFWENKSPINRDQLLVYERNIVSHTLAINEKRPEPIEWKYFQWLTLLFTEIYLDRYFSDKETLVSDLNRHVKTFNNHWPDFENFPDYSVDDLNKLCYQSATGSGKTLLMHVNILQYKHYAEKFGLDKELSRIVLVTPGKELGEQHIAEFHESNFDAQHYLQSRGGLYGEAGGLKRIDVLEITTLADQDGEKTIATRNLGDQNLLIVDEGHRGIGSYDGTWIRRRSELSEKGFTLEYSATFKEAVKAAANDEPENAYSKSIIFDYSYKWFYEDGFGKDYQILNLPKSLEETQTLYLTACLLKYFQQLMIYQDKREGLIPFNMEKPLWVFVGNTVTGKTNKNDKEKTLSHVGMILQFIADFLADKSTFATRINLLLTGTGEDTGLIDKDDVDILKGAFDYLLENYNGRLNAEQIYKDIIKLVFNSLVEGKLCLDRLKGDSGEVRLKVGNSEDSFGLINVGDAPGLCKHLEEKLNNLDLNSSEFLQPIFSTVKDSDSPINILIGSKKFIEGWDCWRVSAMGLMHVGKSEGAQIVQLFGRGIRLKGYRKSLKRSGYSHANAKPAYIEDLETLYVFGVEASFMDQFKKYLEEEGLPGNDRKETFKIPLNVTYDFGRSLKVLKPKKKLSDGRDWDFKKDAPVPTIYTAPKYIKDNKVIVDRYSKITAIESRGHGEVIKKDENTLKKNHLALIDYNKLYFELEKYKRERSWYNLNISVEGIHRLLSDDSWYELQVPDEKLMMKNFRDVMTLQQLATELLKKYIDHYYNYCKREWTEPRLELVDLKRSDDLIPNDDNYQFFVDSSETVLINQIKVIKSELESRKNYLRKLGEGGDLYAMTWSKHLYEPLFHVRKGKITVLPVTLNESEYQFVQDMYDWSQSNQSNAYRNGKELYLLRNLSRGKGIGFFEAGSFYPDFILWVLNGSKQYVNFIEPHGMRQEGAGSEKIKFHKRIKQIEERLGNPDVILNSFILSWTKFPQLNWGKEKHELEDQHVLFMEDGWEEYVEKMMGMIE